MQKYNYHLGEWSKRNVLYWIVNPLNQLRNKRDLHVLLKMSRTYQDVRLERAESRCNMAKFVHDELESALVSQVEDVELRTFFDTGMKSKKK
mgnify:CR=1 FL=1